MTQESGWTDVDLARLRYEGLIHLNRLHSGTATDRDAFEFVAWRRQSVAHEEAFRAAVRLRNLVQAVEERPTAEQDGNVVPFSPPARTYRVTRRQMMGAVAASAVGAAFFAGRTLDMLPSPSEAMADYRTSPGEHRLVYLDRGASVDLNTRTSIDIRKGAAVPTIELISGEAVLSSGPSDIAALVAGQGTSTVRGGQFNARRGGNDVCITCLSGEVDISWAREKRVLRPTDEVRYDSSGIGPVKPGADPAVLTAWRSGTLIFRDMPMHQVVSEINRYRNGHVFLANNALAARPLSGTYYINRLDDFFSQAELGLGVKVSRLPGDIVILS